MLFGVFAVSFVNAANAQCPAITCPGNITVGNDPNTCGAVVNFVAPVGVNPCGAQTFNYTGSIQTYTVPVGVTSLTITAKGAQGGNNGGLGAIITGTVAVTPGSQLKILVGQQGFTNFTTCGTWFGAGGGGGSFVTTNANSPLIVAGGGGGNICTPTINMDANTGNNGFDGYCPAYPTYYGVGGVGGNGATNGPNPPHAGNGGGLNTSGATGLCAQPGVSFVGGGAGGVACIGFPGSDGGYGGGGGGGNAGGGGGGGYSGGGGSYHFPGNGGGGGSYNGGTNQSNTVGNTGNGQVVINGGSATTTLIAGLPPGSLFPIGTTTETYQVTDGLGNYATCSFDITVNDVSTPQITCPGTTTSCTNIVTGIAPVVNNAACPTVTYTMSGATTGAGSNDASGTYFNNGITTVTYKVVTSNGNADSCSFDVSVNPGFPADVTISANPGDTGCIGYPVVFTPTTIAGGPNPAYQWIKNNVQVGTGSTYTDNGLSTGDVIYCVLTSNDPCAPVLIDTSNYITMTMVMPVVPTNVVTPVPNDTICPGASVLFTANVTNEGTNPTYEWYKNNVPVGTNQPTYADGSIVNNDVVKCVLTSNAACATPPVVTSSVTMHTMTETPYLSGTPGNTVTKNMSLLYHKNFVRDANCDLMVMMEPQGNDPVNGSTDVLVTIDNTVQTYAGQPYLQRHYDLHPSYNPITGTSIVTLYAYQSEFDAYNLVADQMGYPRMPENFIYLGGIRISQFHGNGTQPDNYTGQEELINPAVYWDTAHNWWQMSFMSTGAYGGYYIHTGQFPLHMSTVKGGDFSVIAYPNPVADKMTIQVTGNRGNNSTITVTDLTGKHIMTVPMNSDKAIADISALAPGMYLVKYHDDLRSEAINIIKQ